jgi:hypothetical protein
VNRHMIDYSAMPTEVLGTPIRPDPPKPRDGAWKPLRPGYESRTLAGGAVEVRCTSLPVEPTKKAAESIITPLVASAGVDAPTEWQGGRPPSAGWFNCQDDQDRAYRYTTIARYWLGHAWSHYVGMEQGELSERRAAMEVEALPTDGSSGQGHNIHWRGPCLIGESWPEPQQ